MLAIPRRMSQDNPTAEERAATYKDWTSAQIEADLIRYEPGNAFREGAMLALKRQRAKEAMELAALPNPHFDAIYEQTERHQRENFSQRKTHHRVVIGVAIAAALIAAVSAGIAYRQARLAEESLSSARALLRTPPTSQSVPPLSGSPTPVASSTTATPPPKTVP
jgi:hypothetical protein